MTEEDLAEMLEWQARCRDFETSNERIREERDSLINTVVTLRQREDALVTRITELEQLSQKQQTLIDRLTIHVQQGVEL